MKGEYPIEKYLLDIGYSERMLPREICRARAAPKDAILRKVNNQKSNNKIMFNITSNPEFRKEIHVILAIKNRHKKVFSDVPLIGFRNNR